MNTDTINLISDRTYFNRIEMFIPSWAFSRKVIAIAGVAGVVYCVHLCQRFDISQKVRTGVHSIGQLWVTQAEIPQEQTSRVIPVFKAAFKAPAVPLVFARENGILGFAKSLETKLTSSARFQDLQVSTVNGFVEVEFSVGSLFNPGTVDWTEQGLFSMAGLSELLKQGFASGELKGEIAVEGFTDDTTVTKSKKFFRSNWELSAARASAVVRGFEEAGIASESLVVIAHGQTRAKFSNRNSSGEPIVQNQIRNRRIVLKLQTSGGVPL
jgi:flagellar motor protein MotB